MMWRRGRHGWSTVTLSVFSVVLFLGGAMLANGISLGSEQATAGAAPTLHPGVASAAVNATPAITGANCASGWSILYTYCLPPSPVGVNCNNIFNAFLGPDIFGPGCGWLSPAQQQRINIADQHIASENLITDLANYLNQTNAEVANLNATFQELLGYYTSRAEAIIPYFLNATAWNTVLYDAIAVDSGLIPSLTGMETAFAQQQYQDWNATAGTWNAEFGVGGGLVGFQTGFGTAVAGAPPTSSDLLISGDNMGVSLPFEIWSAAPGPIYLNIAPGGSIFAANITNTSGWFAPQMTVYDLTQGFSFPVPVVNYTDWVANDWPNKTTDPFLGTIGQFDVLKATCTANCGIGALGDAFETTNAYVLQNITQLSLGGLDSGVPLLEIANKNPNVPEFMFTPTPATMGVCITYAPAGNLDCGTYIAQTGGNSSSPTTGPGAVVAGNRTLTSFAITAQSLVNNTMILAYDYWQTLRAVTQNGTYAIPANCAIPTPSDAFPAATDFANYKLSALNVEAVFLAYLNAVARGYGQVFTNQVGFCGDPNLGFSFNWTQSWTLRLNITASVYIGSPQGPLNLNGTNATHTTYANVSSWPVYNIDPTLLYPEEYQMDVPINTVYPVPINDPIAGVLVNYPGNLYYGGSGFTPAWGIPTYISLTGNGNYVNVSGVSSHIPSGGNNSSADAIVIGSCFLNGVPQNPCDISVLYFNRFAIGLVHSNLPIQCIGHCGGGGSLSGINDCGFGNLNQWYDSWAGYIGSAVSGAFSVAGNAVSGIPLIGGGLSFLIKGLGCILAWIVVILLVLLFVYVVARVAVAIYRGIRGRQRYRNENVS